MKISIVAEDITEDVLEIVCEHEVERTCPNNPTLHRVRLRVSCSTTEESTDEELNECAVNPLRRGEVAQMSRDVEAGEYTNDGPVILGPGLPPEDGSCGQLAAQFHLTTTTVAGLKRIADARGLSVPELCRQVVGVFVAQQEGDLGALLAAEAEVADYRPSLRRS